METTTTPSTARIALKYGLYASLGLIIYSTIIQIMDMATNPMVGIINFFVGLVILTIATIYGVKEFKSDNQGAISLGQSIGIATLLAAIAGAAASIFSFIYITFIDPSSMQKVFDAQREQLEKQGMSDTQIDQAIEMGQKFMPLGFVLAPFLYAIGGVILGLIIGAIMKKDRDVFAQ